MGAPLRPAFFPLNVSPVSRAMETAHDSSDASEWRKVLPELRPH